MTEVKVPTLTRIQSELKAPKNQINSFGHYKYRNAEDIMQGVKPLLAKYGASLYIAEDLEVIQDRIIVTESAVYKDDSQEVTVKGHAPVSMHKGMSDEQAWGTASSYATKYALSKLFLLDDSQDVNSLDNGNGQPLPRRQPRKAPVNQESQQLLSKVDGTPSPVRLANMAKSVKLKTKSMGEPTLLEVYAKYKEEGNGGPASKLLSYYSAHDEKIMKIVSELEKQWADVKKEISK